METTRLYFCKIVSHPILPIQPQGEELKQFDEILLINYILISYPFSFNQFFGASQHFLDHQCHISFQLHIL